MQAAKILVGADPELFMKNPNTNMFVSAHDRVPGTKYEPFKVPNGAIQVDGTALEFNIDPAHSVEEFVANIKSVKQTLESYVPGFNVVAEPVALYDADYWVFEVTAEAKTLGCDPDFNGWTVEQNPPPNAGDKPFRTASGHVHIGWTKDKTSSTRTTTCCAARWPGRWTTTWASTPCSGTKMTPGATSTARLVRSGRSPTASSTGS